MRRHNEDSLIAEAGLFAVADGMGGHAAGDVASRMVVEQLHQLHGEVPIPLAAVGDLVVLANAAVRERAAEAGTTGMGTTLVAVLLVDNAGFDSLVVVNVGDSRCYVQDETGLRVLTRDHSLVQELVDAGRISPEEARHHPDRNVVTRAIGVDEHVLPDFVVLERSARQRLLLCSDGVSGQVDHGFLASVLGGSGDPAEAVEAIVGRVLEGRAPDNATAIVVDVEWDETLAGSGEITGPRPEREADRTGPRPVSAVPVVAVPDASGVPVAGDQQQGSSASPSRSTPLITEVPR
ncbi:MAG: protein phosphatase 2C domain-containing protein [Ilumatobacteraceae bacterium]